MKKVLCIFVMCLCILFLGYVAVVIRAKGIAESKRIITVKGYANYNLRSHPGTGTNSRVFGPVYIKDEFSVLEIYAPYIKVTVYDIKTTKTHTGWIWVGRIKKEKKEQYISGDGVTMRATPNKNGKHVAYIFPGSKILKVLDEYITWYKITGERGMGWVCKEYVEVK